MMTILHLLAVLGALGIFLFGMKLMSESLQKVAGKRMRNTLVTITANRFRSLSAGLIITGIIQSSSATTVMIISFVNAGLLTLYQATGVIFGANIGTTFTAWIITFLGFKFSPDSFILPIIGIAIPFYLSSKLKLKSYGELMFGFALLFLGLQLLKQTLPLLVEPYQMMQALSGYQNHGFATIIVFVCTGLIITTLIQSSSATFALILVMNSQGWFNFEASMAMVIGMNIGTTSTAFIASLIANLSSKRAALIHFLFNLIGAVWALALFGYSISFLNWFTVNIEGSSPLENLMAVPIALSIYHTAFNLINTALLINFIPQLIKVTGWIIPNRRRKEHFSLKFIDSTISTAELSLIQAGKLISSFGLRTEAMFGFIPQLLIEKDEKRYEKLFKRIQKYEDISDNMDNEIEAYVTRLSETGLSTRSSHRIHAMMKVIDNLESINDQCIKMSKLIDQKNREKAWFTQEMRNELGEMFSLVMESISITNKNIEQTEQSPDLSRIFELESRIDDLRNVLLSRNNERIANETIPYTTSR